MQIAIAVPNMDTQDWVLAQMVKCLKKVESYHNISFYLKNLFVMQGFSRLYLHCLTCRNTDTNGNHQRHQYKTNTRTE